MQDHPNGEVVVDHMVEEHMDKDMVVVDVVGLIKDLQNHLVQEMLPCCHRNKGNGLDK